MKPLYEYLVDRLCRPWTVRLADWAVQNRLSLYAFPELDRGNPARVRDVLTWLVNEADVSRRSAQDAWAKAEASAAEVRTLKGALQDSKAETQAVTGALTNAQSALSRARHQETLLQATVEALQIQLCAELARNTPAGAPVSVPQPVRVHMTEDRCPDIRTTKSGA